jgi:ribosomal protein L20
MTAREATAEVFWTAFRTLPKADREAVIQRLLKDREIRENLIDNVTAVQRQHEKSIPYERVRADLKKTGRL